MFKTKEINSFSASSSHAFKITLTSSPSNPNQLICRVSPGTINNILPSNIFNDFTVSNSQLTYVIAKATTDSKAINSCLIELKQSTIVKQIPAPFGLPTTVEILIGVIYNGQIFQCVTNNIGLGGKLQYIESRSNPEPGALPYTAYFIWS